MARYTDNTDRLYQLVESLDKRITLQQTEINELNAYKNKVETLYRENNEMVLLKIFKHSERIIPQGDVISFQPVELTGGHYILDVSMTYVNADVATDAGVVLGLFLHDPDAGTETLLSTGSAAWFGRVHGTDQYSSFQTVLIRATMAVKDKRIYYFVVKRMGVKHSRPVTHNEEFPCLFTIF
jgi:hypothetical protein